MPRCLAPAYCFFYEMPGEERRVSARGGEGRSRSDRIHAAGEARPDESGRYGAGEVLFVVPPSGGLGGSPQTA